MSVGTHLTYILFSPASNSRVSLYGGQCVYLWVEEAPRWNGTGCFDDRCLCCLLPFAKEVAIDARDESPGYARGYSGNGLL